MFHVSHATIAFLGDPVKPLAAPFAEEILAPVIAAITEWAQASSVAVAGHLVVELGRQLGSTLTHLYRLLGNRRIDDQLLRAWLLQLLWGG